MRFPTRTISSSWLSEISARSFDTADRRHSQTFKFGILFLFTVGLFWYAGVEACFRPMWLDEYLTLWLTQISGGSAFWTAFFSGAENNPPFYFMAARAASQLLGPSSFALRLPSLLGFWLMCLGLYGLVARRCNLAFAWAAMILPTCTFAMRYAYDARPYGLWLGLSAVALFCWQGSTIHHRRLLHLLGLAVCLGLTIWTHFYSVLFFIPLGLGELVRTRSRRRVDVGIWTAFALGLLPILGLTGLIQQTAQLRENFWATPKWFQIVDTYSWLFQPAVTPLIATLTLILWMTSRNHDGGTESKQNEPIGVPLVPIHELVAVTGLVAMPLITMVLAKLVTNAYWPRYALPTVIGCDLLIILSAAILTRNRPAVGVSLALILGGWFACVGNPEAESSERRLKDMPGIMRGAELARRSGLPWIFRDTNSYLDALFTCNPDLRDQLIFVPGGEGTFIFRGLQEWPSARGLIQSIEFEDLQRRRQPFLYLYSPLADKALYAQMLRGHARFVWCETIQGLPFFEVSWPSTSPDRPDHEQQETLSPVSRWSPDRVMREPGMARRGQEPLRAVPIH